MKIRSVKTIVAAIMSVVLVACASSPKKDLALEHVRAQMDELQADTALVAYAQNAQYERRKQPAGTRPSGFM
jgi:outer membrane murein-binding lipoprotein Lpp